jgi:hypothetical protein
LRQRRLKEGLGLHADPTLILAYRDSMNGLEYLRRAVGLAEHGLTVELHAYECHVLLDWRELRATAERPWDALCDQLAGRGVANLEDALVELELRPTHDALRHLLEPAQARSVAEVAKAAPSGPEKLKALEILREDYLEAAWSRCRKFLREAQTFYRTRGEAQVLHLLNPAALKERFRARARAAMRIPVMEDLFPERWPAAARRVLPSHSPQLTATALWGPVLAWSALELLAESVDAVHPERAALDLFDRLRLREPLGHAFEALGFAGEEAWRVAARIKVALLVEAKVSAPEDEATIPESTEAEKQVIPVLPPSLWQDPDVRWLTGAHESEGYSYFVKESYEELLWWLQLPALCRVASEAPPSRAAIRAIGKAVADTVKAADKSGYRIGAPFETGAAEPTTDEVAGEVPPEVEAAPEAKPKRKK